MRALLKFLNSYHESLVSIRYELSLYLCHSKAPFNILFFSVLFRLDYIFPCTLPDCFSIKRQQVVEIVLISSKMMCLLNSLKTFPGISMTCPRSSVHNLACPSLFSASRLGLPSCRHEQIQGLLCCSLLLQLEG